MEFSGLIKQLSFLVSKNTPTILTAVSVAGLVTTVAMAINATPRAVEIIDKEATVIDDLGHANYVDPSFVTKVKLTWRLYIPTLVMGATTVACMIGSNAVHLRRNAAIAGAYSLLERSMTEYQRKVVEVVGEKKNQKVLDEIAQDQVDRTPVKDSQVIITGGGETLCLDSMSGRYYKSSIEELRRIENQLNHRLINGSWLCLNELYSEVGLEPIKLGEELGWVPDNLLQLRFSTALAGDGTPCLVVDFVVDPRLDPYRS